MLIFCILCYASMLKFLTYYAQYYAHIKDLCLFTCTIQKFNVVIVLLENSTHYIYMVAQIIIIVDVLLEYSDLQSY